MTKPKLTIFREFQDDKQTSGRFSISDVDTNFTLFTSVCLERGWKNNEFRISCLPKGIYTLVYEYSDKFDRYLWEFKNTHPRTECKFHSASFWFDLNGCVSLGAYYGKINTDEYLDLKYSAAMINKMHEVLKPFQDQTLQIEITGLSWLN